VLPFERWGLESASLVQSQKKVQEEVIRGLRTKKRGKGLEARQKGGNFIFPAKLKGGDSGKGRQMPSKGIN